VPKLRLSSCFLTTLVPSPFFSSGILLLLHSIGFPLGKCYSGLKERLSNGKVDGRDNIDTPTIAPVAAHGFYYTGSI